MNKHFQPFFISLIIHILIFVGILYTYTTFTSLFFTKKEKRVAIVLNSYEREKKSNKKIKKIQKISKKQKKSPKRKKSIKKEPKIKKHVVKKKESKIKKRLLKKKESENKKIEEKKIEKSKPLQNKFKNILKKKESTPLLEQIEKPRAVSEAEIYKRENFNYILELLQENLYYPRRARRRGVEGEVKVEFTLLPNGEIGECRVLSSSAEILSRAAVKTIENLSGKFVKPKKMIKITVPIKYSLND
jgi:protein TonB